MVGDGSQRQGRKGRKPSHKSQLESEQSKLPRDQQSADDQNPVGHEQPRPHRDPPQILRLRQTRAEHGEGEHQPEVRGVEDVASTPADQVLRCHRDGDHADKDPDAVQAPPLAMKGAGRPQDEGGAVAGQQSAGRPHDRLVLEDGDDEFDQGARRETDENLRHREPEAEHGLAEYLEGDQHRSHVHPRIADGGQDDRVLAAENPNRPALSATRRNAHRSGGSRITAGHPSVTVGAVRPLQNHPLVSISFAVAGMLPGTGRVDRSGGGCRPLGV